MCVTICGGFGPDEGAVAGYGNRIRVKYTAKWGVQIAGMIFQSHSKACAPAWSVFLCNRKFQQNFLLHEKTALPDFSGTAVLSITLAYVNISSSSLNGIRRSFRSFRYSLFHSFYLFGYF